MTSGKNLLAIISALALGGGSVGCSDYMATRTTRYTGTHVATHEDNSGNLQTILQQPNGQDPIAARDLFKLLGFIPGTNQATLVADDTAEDGFTPGTTYKVIDILNNGILIAERQDFTGGSGGQIDVVAFDLNTILESNQFDKPYDTGTPFQTERFIQKIGNDSFLMSKYSQLTNTWSAQVVTPGNAVGTQVSNLVSGQDSLVVNSSDRGISVLEKDAVTGNYIRHRLDETTKSLVSPWGFPTAATSVDSKSTMDLVSWTDTNLSRFSAVRFMSGGSNVSWETTMNAGDSIAVEALASDGNAQIYSVLNAGVTTYNLLNMIPNNPSITPVIGAMPATFGAFEGTSGGHITNAANPNLSAIIEGALDSANPDNGRYIVSVSKTGVVSDDLATLYSGAIASGSTVTANLGHSHRGSTFVEAQITPTGANPDVTKQLLYVSGDNSFGLEDVFNGAYDNSSVIDTSEDGRYALIRGEKSNSEEFIVWDMETDSERLYLPSMGGSLGDRQTKVAEMSDDGNQVVYVTRETLNGETKDVLNMIDLTDVNNPTIYRSFAVGDSIEPHDVIVKTITGVPEPRVYATVDNQLKVINPDDSTEKNIEWFTTEEYKRGSTWKDMGWTSLDDPYEAGKFD